MYEIKLLNHIYLEKKVSHIESIMQDTNRVNKLSKSHYMFVENEMLTMSELRLSDNMPLHFFYICIYPL